jgi:hypothetical protein
MYFWCIWWVLYQKLTKTSYFGNNSALDGACMVVKSLGSNRQLNSLQNEYHIVLRGISCKKCVFYLFYRGGPYGTAVPCLKKHLKSFLEHFLLCTGAKVCRIDIFVIFG